MATFDNKHWLLSNIRNSFISTDDTGMCEIVMTGENFPKLFYNKAMEEKNRLKETSPNKPNELNTTETNEEVIEKEIVTEYDPYPDMEDSDEEDFNCSDIRCEDFAPYRQRSNTAVWLDKKEQALKKAAKIEIVKWENPTKELTTEEQIELFPRKELPKPVKEVKSLLTDQLEKCPHLPHRQYSEYAKFDGTAQIGLATKNFRIFMTMLPEKYHNYPIDISVIASAKIQDLIGYICYKYSIQHPEVSLGSVHDYGLCLVEDDGEVDWAFPCLDANEPCSKFCFNFLGLIHLKNKRTTPTSAMSIPEVGGLSGDFPTMYQKQSSSDHSQHRHNTGGSGTSEAVIHALQTLNDEKKASIRDSVVQSHILVTEAPQYKTYRVLMLQRMRNTPVQLGISLDKIELEPVISSGSHFWSRTKYFLHTIDTVACCKMLDNKSNKAVFRLVYSRGNSTSDPNGSNADNSFFHPTSAYKHHDFECDYETAKQVVDKINQILDLRNSPCHREYETAKAKKQQSRRSFHTSKNVSYS